MKTFLFRNGFLLGLVLAIGLAVIFPEYGSDNGSLHAGLLSKIGVVLIFFFQGVMLASEKLKEGVLEWKLHLVIQGYIFLIIPFLGILFIGLAGSFFPESIQIGFIYLAVLPTTVSSAVVFTSLAGGNVPVALFNTIISNLVGVVLTPVLINLFMNARTSSGFESLGGLIQTIALLILLPFVIGQICRWLMVGEYWKIWKKPVEWISRSIVLFIVFNTFSDSIIKGVWSGQGVRLTVSVFGGVIVFAVVVLLVVALGSRWMRLAPPENAAMCFLASHKTLAAGVPMAKLIFLGRSDLALILLPIMFYHPLQLIVSGWLVTRFKFVSEKLK